MVSQVAAMIRVIGVAMDTGEMSQGAPEEASGTVVGWCPGGSPLALDT